MLPWTGASATTQGRKAFLSGGARRGRGRAGWCGPQGISLPTAGQHHEGLPDRSGRLPSAAPASCPPGHPLTASQEGPGVRTRAANCLSPHWPTVSQERPKSHSGNSGLPGQLSFQGQVSGSPPMVTLVTAEFATQIPFPLLLARAPHWTLGEPPSHHSQSMSFRGLHVLRWVTKADHVAQTGQSEPSISLVL